MGARKISKTHLGALFDSYEEALAKSRETTYEKPWDIMMFLHCSLESRGYRITRIPGWKNRQIPE
jgi:hypothetical protein